MTPIERLVKRLTKRWNEADAIVVSDWCETTGLKQPMHSLRRALKEGTTDHTFKDIQDLAWVMGLSRAFDTTTLDWLIPNQKGKIAKAGLCGYEWEGRSLKRSLRAIASASVPIFRFSPSGGKIRRCTRPLGHKGDHQADPNYGRVGKPVRS